MTRLSKLLVPATLLALAGCGGMFASTKTARLTAAPEQPAAMGEIKISKTDNDNTKVKVEVKHLAPPTKASPGAMTYVVWVQPTGQNRTINIGGLKVDDDLNGSLEATTPFHSFEVFITAEADAAVMSPRGPRMLWTQVRR